MRGTSGFTLVELLAVMATVLVMAALLVSGTSSARKRAEDARCLSNLRQIGAAMSLYVQENNNTLPGPLLNGQYAKFDQKAYLAYLLAPYLSDTISEDQTQNTAQRSKIFMCPGWWRESPNRSAYGPTYQMNASQFTNMGTVKPRTFWGSVDANLYYQPMTFTQAAGAIENSGGRLSQTWMLCDVDRKVTKYAGADWAANIPANPVHGKVRNALFFDYHVEPLELSKSGGG